MKVGVIEEMLEDTMEALPDPADDDIKEIMLFKIFKSYTFKHKTLY